MSFSTNITYRSDFDADFRYLEDSIARGDFGELNDLWKYQLEQEKGFFEWKMREIYLGYLTEGELNILFREMQKDEIVLPTRFDSVSQHSILTGLIEDIEKSAREFNLEFEQFPHSSTIPTGRVNACAVKFDCSDRVFLLFDSQLFLYCHLFSKAFSLCLPVKKSDSSGIQLSTNIDEVKVQVQNNTNKCVERFIDVLRSYVLEGAPSAAAQYLVPKEYISFVEILRQGMELMVVGHEFGHFNAGHLGGAAWRDLHMLPEVNLYNLHREEIEADFWGGVLTLQAMIRNGNDPALSFIGIDLFFSAMIFSERYRSLSLGVRDEEFQEKKSGSHPTFGVRQAYMREVINYIDGIKEHAATIQKLCQFYDEALECMWLVATRT